MNEWHRRSSVSKVSNEFETGWIREIFRMHLVKMNKRTCWPSVGHNMRSDVDCRFRPCLTRYVLPWARGNRWLRNACFAFCGGNEMWAINCAGFICATDPFIDHQSAVFYAQAFYPLAHFVLNELQKEYDCFVSKLRVMKDKTASRTVG